MNRSIRKVAVLGSGVMGSAIACHFANIGCKVLLLDMVPRELNDEERAKGLTLESKQVRNRIVNQSLERAIRSNPAPLYDKSFASRILTGNFDDDMHIISKRSEEHTSELQSRENLVCRLLLEKKNNRAGDNHAA